MAEPTYWWLYHPIRRARIIHRCCYCGKDIGPGTYYRDANGRKRAHLECVDKLLPRMKCGHPHSAKRAFRYRCNLYSHPHGCREMHVTSRCSICWDAGEDRPNDFGHEVSRDHANR